jgi:O-antigen ligase
LSEIGLARVVARPPGGVGGLVSAFGAVLAAGHFLLSAATLAASGPTALAVTAFGVLLGGAMAFTRRGLATGLVFLGFGLFLFGCQSYVYPAVAFGLLLDAVVLALCWRNVANSGAPATTGLVGALVGAVAALCLASTLLLPWDRFGTALGVFGPTGFFAAMVFSPADAPAYSLASAWRLALFAVFARELARLDLPARFALLAEGVTGGLVTAIVFGLLEHFRGDHYLLHYRFTSLFANPGWFAEYLAVAVPYLLVPLGRQSRWRRVYAAVSLALCAAALVLTLARAGWIAGGLTFAAALLLYFRPGPLARFHRPLGHLPTLAMAGALVVGLAFWGMGKELSAISRPINALLKERVGNFTESPRPALFRSGLCIAAERPLFGMGFETYARNYPVLLATTGTWLNRFGDPKAEVFETSHNMYIQLLSGLGLAGLVLWLAMAGRAGYVLWRRARALASLPDAAALLSLAAFHVYAFFQEMFYVPPVLFLLFVPLARAMALDGEGWTRRTRLVVAGAWLLVLAGAASYAADAGLARTASRLGLSDWRPAGETVTFEGFYGMEDMGGTLSRWSAGDGILLTTADEIGLTLSAPTPLTVTLSVDGAPLDALELGATAVTRRYVLPGGGKGKAKVVCLVPSRTFLPQALAGAPDPRRLGVAVGVSP